MTQRTTADAIVYLAEMVKALGNGWATDETVHGHGAIEGAVMRYMEMEGEKREVIENGMADIAESGREIASAISELAQAISASSELKS